MRFTDVTAAIHAHAQVSDEAAEAIAVGLIERGMITGDVRAVPKACECCGTRFVADHAGQRYCSAKCVSVCEHL